MYPEDQLLVSLWKSATELDRSIELQRLSVDCFAKAIAAAAQYAVNYAASQGATAKVWWLDVELFPPNPNYWSSNQQVNAAIIQGALDGLQAMGTTGGIYSTITQWNAITGGYPTSAPEWVPGAGPLAQAVTWCQPGALRTGNPANGTVAFSHGPVWLIQYGYVSPQPPFDVDYSC